jgi:hypothetical protein
MPLMRGGGIDSAASAASSGSFKSRDGRRRSASGNHRGSSESRASYLLGNRVKPVLGLHGSAAFSKTSHRGRGGRGGRSGHGLRLSLSFLRRPSSSRARHSSPASSPDSAAGKEDSPDDCERVIAAVASGQDLKEEPEGELTFIRANHEVNDYDDVFRKDA